jgi:hypothetical protein
MYDVEAEEALPDANASWLNTETTSSQLLENHS